MQRYDFFFGQKVTEGELDAAFQAVEDAQTSLCLDTGLVGITTGADVTQNAGTANMTVDVAGPATIYDQLGQRVSWSAKQDVDCSVDENSNPTAVVTPGNHRILSIFAKYKRVLSDPRIDAESTTVYFNRAESFELHVASGAEAGSPTPPILRSDEILLADIELDYAQTQILNADISITRRQWAIKTTSGTAVGVGTVEEAVQVLATAVDDHITDSAGAHAGTAISYAGGTAWHDGTTNPATTVEAQLDKIVSELADEGTVGLGGSDRVGSETFTVAARVIPTGSVRDQLEDVLQVTTDHIDDTTDAHAGTAIGYAGGVAWHDGTTNPATTVEAQLDKIVSELADEGSVGLGGADRIGSETFTVAARVIPTGSVRDQLEDVLQVSTDHIDDSLGAHATSAVSGVDMRRGSYLVPLGTAQAQLETLLYHIYNSNISINKLHVESYTKFGGLDTGYYPVEFAQCTAFGIPPICVANKTLAAPKSYQAMYGVAAAWNVVGFAIPTDPSDTVECVVAGNDIFVAGGKYGVSGTGGWIETSDATFPVSWTSRTPTGFTSAGCSVKALAFSSGSGRQFIAVGGDGTNGKIAVSNYGTTWAAPTSYSGGGAQYYIDVAINSIRTCAVAITKSSRVHYSSGSNFETWSVASSFTDISPDGLYSITYDRVMDLFVISGQDSGAQKFWTSSDGANWAEYIPTSISTPWVAVESNKNGAVIGISGRDIIVLYQTGETPVMYHYTAPAIADVVSPGVLAPHALSFAGGRVYACLVDDSVWGTTLQLF